MKRAFSIIFVLCIILSLIPAADAAGDPAVSLSKVKAAPGDDISVDIVLSDNPGINTCTFGVEYDSNVLTLNSVRAAEAVGGSFVFEKRGVWFSESDTSYSGTFFTLDFTVAKGAATGAVSYTHLTAVRQDPPYNARPRASAFRNSGRQAPDPWAVLHRKVSCPYI